MKMGPEKISHWTGELREKQFQRHTGSTTMRLPRTLFTELTDLVSGLSRPGGFEQDCPCFAIKTEGRSLIPLIVTDG
jgi:hypothetical protein